MKPHAISLLVLFLLPSPPADSKDKSKTSQRVGDLVLSLVEMQQREPQNQRDHHVLVVRLRAENIGKQALCVGFGSTLKASFGLLYHGAPPLTNGFRVHELLPGEQTEGDLEFFVKNGAEPLEVILRPTSESQTCVREKDSFSAILHGKDEVKFDLTGLADHSSANRPQASPQETTSSEPQAQEAAKIRVFLTDKKDATPKENAVRAFQGHCPQARITTERDKANYIVELSPAGLKQSKNLVRVVNSTGDLLLTGATLNLSNAAKDACAAILKDFNTGSQ